MEKFGRLAPSKEVAKRLDIQSQVGQPYEEVANERLEEVLAEERDDSILQDEPNFYNLNDSFIDDADANSEESEDEFFKLSLKYGNYSEAAILGNLAKVEKLQSVNKLPKGKKNETDSSFKKRKFNEISESRLPSTSNALMTTEVPQEKTVVKPTETMVENEVNKLLGELSPELTEMKDKLNILKKILTLYKKFYNDKVNLCKLLELLSTMIKEKKESINIVLEFEHLKGKREGVYSNLSKLIRKYFSNMLKNNIRLFQESIDVENNEYLGQLNTIKEKVNTYMGINQEVFDYFHSSPIITEHISKFVTNSKTQVNDLSEAKDKIVKKLNEILYKHEISFTNEEVETFVRRTITETGKMMDVNEVVDISSCINYVEPETKSKKNSNLTNSVFETDRPIENCRDGKEKLILSKQFYVKQYEPEDFN